MTPRTDRSRDEAVDVGPSWYPIVLALTAWPCPWLGGALHRTGQAG